MARKKKEEQPPEVEEQVEAGAEEPAAEEPPAEEPAAQEPPVEEPSAEAPAAEEPAAGEPVAEDAPAEEPSAEEPLAEEPLAEEPLAEEPPVEEPAAEEPAAEEPRTEEPSAPAPAKKSDLPPGADLEPIAIESDKVIGAEERARLEAEAEERARLEAEATAEGTDEPAAAPRKIDLEAGTVYIATGKRKSSIARVRLSAGEGKIEINKRALEEYFPRAAHQSIAKQPLATSGFEGSVDVRVRVHGGGISGQAGAVRHGIARALCEVDPELRGELKKRGLLTRDARAKERRKAGLKKARKRPQFSKR